VTVMQMTVAEDSGHGRMAGKANFESLSIKDSIRLLLDFVGVGDTKCRSPFPSFNFLLQVLVLMTSIVAERLKS
jgi:hypothetical protein